jgi:5,10-methenyltetrahydromethanopterin hydrogenase
MAIDNEQFRFLAIVTVFGTATVGAVVYPLARALARRLEGRPSGMSQELAQEVLDRVQQLEQTQARIHELEERLDFAERMLAQQRDSERLAPGRE